MRLTLAELLAATGGVCDATPAAGGPYRRVQLDSRKIQPGDIFWAVRGERLDGHDYLDEAIRKGAAVCVAEARRRIRENSVGVENDRILTNSATEIHVPNTTAALADLARWHRGRSGATVIGVTGSVGKTTTRHMIHAALSSRLAGMQSPKNFNNHLGVPLSLLEIESEHSFAVLELGASRVGEIQELAEIAKPTIGVVTAVAPAHVEGFGSIENIERAKGELVESLPRNGLAVLNGDDPRVRRMAQRTTARVLLVGESDGNQVTAADVRSEIGSLAFRFDGHEYEVPTTGRHFLRSALAAVAIGREFGLSPADITHGLQSFRPADGRCVVRRLGEITVIDDTYNASPQSMQAALRLLAEWPGAGRRIALLGDMRELGTEAGHHHSEIGRIAAQADIDRLVAVGHHARDVVQGALECGMEKSQATACEDLDDAFARVQSEITDGDVVLVKGSRSTAMERAVEWLARRMEIEHTRFHHRPHRPCAGGEMTVRLPIGDARLLGSCAK